MKKTFLLFILALGFGAKAQLSAGFFTATASSSITTAGTHTWSMPGGGTYGMAFNILPGSLTHGLHVHGFGFNIPAASQIVGVEAVLSYCVMPTSSGNTIMKDSIVKLVVNNLPVGANQGCVHNFTPIVTTHTYGDPSSTWSVNLTPADVNASTFGFVSYLKSIGTATSFATIEKSQSMSPKMKVYYVSTTGVIESQTSTAGSYYYSQTLYVKDVYEDTKLEVFNLEGRRVYETIVEKDQTRVDLGKLQTGVYFCKMMLGKKEMIQKILVE